MESEIDGQDGMILTLPRTRMRSLRSYKQIERLYDETDILGVSLRDTINDWLELMSDVYLWVLGSYLAHEVIVLNGDLRMRSATT